MVSYCKPSRSDTELPGLGCVSPTSALKAQGVAHSRASVNKGYKVPGVDGPSHSSPVFWKRQANAHYHWAHCQMSVAFFRHAPRAHQGAVNSEWTTPGRLWAAGRI